MTDMLVCWLTYELVGWFVAWSEGSMINLYSWLGCAAGWMAGLMDDLWAGLMDDMWTGRPAAWSEGSVINLCSCRQVVQQGGWLVCWFNCGLAGLECRLAHWSVGWLIRGLAGWLFVDMWG